jgi:hypothetical protein
MTRDVKTVIFKGYMAFGLRKLKIHSESLTLFPDSDIVCTKYPLIGLTDKHDRQ